MPDRPLLAIAALALCLSVSLGRAEGLTDAKLEDSELTLAHCFALAREHNARLREALEAVVATRGEKIMITSRLLPQVGVAWGYGESAQRDTGATGLSTAYTDDSLLDIELRQRLAEFGKTRDSEFERIRRRRRSLYGYEDEVVSAFSNIRRSYFTLKIIEQQLAQHDSLLAYYARQHARARERLEKGIALKTMLLTARLNRLEEEERILRLRSRRHKQLARLKELLGLAGIPGEASLVTTMDSITLTEDSCVALSLERSTEVADAEMETEIAHKKLRQWLWEFAPDVALAAGVHRSDRSAEIEVNQPNHSKRQWAVDMVTSKSFQQSQDVFFTARDSLLRYTAMVKLQFPIFKGLRRMGTRVKTQAEYEQARAVVVARTRSTETATRGAYYDYQLSTEQLAIEKKRVEIARERYELAQTLHELGRISEDGFDGFRERLFWAQDAFFEQQFDVLAKQEDLRALLREFE